MFLHGDLVDLNHKYFQYYLIISSQCSEEKFEELFEIIRKQK